jgi:hypothetical protein
MWERIKNNFTKGVKKTKWLSSLVSERVKTEFMVIKLLYQSEQFNEQKSDLLKKIGKRVLELKDQREGSILKDSVVADSLREIERIDTDIESTKQKASEISKIEA